MGRILGIDYGTRRIGLALSDEGREFARALEIVEGLSPEKGLARIAELCRENEVDRIIVGLPLNMNGSAGPMAAEARAFAEKLALATGIQTETVDERMSSMAAERMMLEADLSRGRRKQLRDKIAAQVILQGYLDGLNHAPL